MFVSSMCVVLLKRELSDGHGPCVLNRSVEGSAAIWKGKASTTQGQELPKPESDSCQVTLDPETFPYPENLICLDC